MRGQSNTYDIQFLCLNHINYMTGNILSLIPILAIHAKYLAASSEDILSTRQSKTYYTYYSY